MSATDTHPDALHGDSDTLRSQRVWKAAAEPDLDFESQRLRASLRSKMFGVAAAPISIGRFKVLETVGSGGMGVVYAAYDEELDRRVAVKLLRSGVGDDASVGKGRLLREAQALAKLSHPNVVQVYEAGTFDGRVFLAMEFLPGPTLRDWLLDEPRPWRQVLDHFVEAGEGLAAAHREGIVHRDLKPANLLLGSDGRVRVVDFGLARADGPVRVDAPDDGETEPSSAFGIELTQTGEIMGTPAYMAPEQARQEGVDARSDQYSFCVALYEGLFGQRPHVGRSTAEVIVAVAEGIVQPPPRGTKVPARVTRAIMRGLSADPARRFPSMSALLVELSPERRGWWKWAAAGTAVAAVLTAFIPGPSPCPSFDDALDPAWSPAQRAALEQAFAASGAPQSEAAARHVGAQLDAYAAQWLEARRDACESHLERHEQSARLHDLRVACLLERRVELSTLARTLGEADATVVEHAPEAVLELPSPAVCNDVERVLARADDDPADEDLRLRLVEARTQMSAGRYDEALAAVEEVAVQARARHSVGVEAEAQYQRAIVQERRRVFGPAVAALEVAVDLAEVAGRDELAARAWMALARQQSWQGEHERAAQSLRLARAKVRRLRDDQALVSDWLESRAKVADQEGHPDSAITDQRQVVERLQAAGASELRRAEAIKRLGDFLSDGGKHEEARARYEEARAVYSAALGEDHPRLAQLEVDVAVDLWMEGRNEEARTRFLRAEQLLEASLGPRAPALLTVNKTLADLSVAAGELPEAERRARKTLELWSAVEDAPLGHRLDALAVLGTVLQEQGDSDEAISCFRSYLELAESPDAQDEYRQLALYVRVGLAESLDAAGRHDEAVQEAERALAVVAGDQRYVELEPVVRRISKGAAAEPVAPLGGA